MDTYENSRGEVLKYDSENSGIDIHCPEDLQIYPKVKCTINLGIKCQLLKNGENCAFWLLPRSSLGAKTPLIMCNSIGLIDKGYRGELKAVVYNTGVDVFYVKKNDRLFQIANSDLSSFDDVLKKENLQESVRGENGFGSTGKN